VSDPAPIRITRDEAMSSHVEDLLQRQRSLRGQRTTGDRKVPWYFRNWLVLGFAGLAGALLAWSLLEPFFDDVPYMEGTVQSVDATPRTFGEGDEQMHIQGTFEFHEDAGGRLEVMVLAETRQMRDERAGDTFDLASLPTGARIGLYAEALPIPGQDNKAMARWVDLAPDSGSAKARLSLKSQERRSSVAGFLLFSVVAALVGMTIGGVDGIVCRQPRRAILSALIGGAVGLIGGFVSSILASVIYMPFTALASNWMAGTMAPLGFLMQIIGRTLAWMLAGMAMGLGQGVSLRSKRLLLFGFLGGTLGGLLGGLLFDPIDFVILGTEKPSAHVSRLVGLGVIGAGVGVMIGVVELLARDAWLRMTEGPLAGKEFLLFKDVLRIGADSSSEIYLFGDPQVAPHHATLRTVGDDFEVENHNTRNPLLVNGRPVDRRRLNHGDQIAIGRTSFTFQRRQG
jgi:hypothetical protein